MAEEEGFVFVDKRHTAGADASDKGASGAEQPADTDAGEEAGPESQSGPEDGENAHPRLQGRDRILMSMDILLQGAWIALGLVPDPVTNKIERDLDDARLLIDSFADLAERVQNNVEDATRRDLRRLIAELRMNYVNQAGRAG